MSEFTISKLDYTTLSPSSFNNSDESDAVYHHYKLLSWDRIFAVLVFLLLIFITIIGNTLVILSVLTTRRLRTVTNCFVMNLAVTDWLVGVFVMPPAVVYYIAGSWEFGWILCDIWLSLDVLLCTASILSLCAIGLDRYLAVIQPLNYSKKRRSKRLALIMIFVVWIVALSITCPPFLGWYDSGRHKYKSKVIDCRYNQNKGYVVFSAMGSFFIPLTVMLYVYLRIGIVLTSRKQRMTLTEACEKSADTRQDNYSKGKHKIFGSRSDSAKTLGNCLTSELFETNANLPTSETYYELIEISRLSSFSSVKCSTISCKYSAQNNNYVPIHTIHLSHETCHHTSFSETCLSRSKISEKNINHQNLQQNHNTKSNSGSSGVCHKVPLIPMRVSTLKRESKTAKTLTMVMGGFIACWLPFFIYYLLMPFLPKHAVSYPLMSILTWIGWVNCAINPFIYAFYNIDFRVAFWRLTFKKLCKTKKKQQQKQNHQKHYCHFNLLND